MQSTHQRNITMLDVTIKFADRTEKTIPAAWFTTTYGFDLKAPAEESDDPHDLLELTCAMEPTQAQSITFTMEPAAVDDISTPKFLYLHPWHGRSDPNEKLGDWGFDGPCIGPLTRVVFNCGKIPPDEAMTWPAEDQPSFVITHADGKEETIKYQEDLGIYNGEFFGDWSVITAEAAIAEQSVVAYQREHEGRQKVPNSDDGLYMVIEIDSVPYECRVGKSGIAVPNIWGQAGLATVIHRHPHDEAAGEVSGIGVHVEDGEIFIQTTNTDQVIEVVRYINNAFDSVGWELLLP